MQISLFKCTSEKNRVNKTPFISNRYAIDGYLKDATSCSDPVITIEKNSNPIAYDYNYMYIEEFKRYYYITDIVNINNKIWEIHAHVDVLFSFSPDIKSSMAILDKSEGDTTSNLYMNDGSFVMDSRKYNELKEFPDGFNENGSYILICAGGV